MTADKQPLSAIASVVIPAHNEENVIGRCLTKLLAGARPGELEVVVVCNGCQDRTATIAGAFSPSVRVAEIATASKVDALNLGDQIATRYPRLYIDADIELTTDSVRQLVAALKEPGVLAAQPRLEFELTGASPLVRAHSRAWLMLSYSTDSMVGSGVLALSEAGRRRFGMFPDVVAEDLFVRNLFGLDERRTVKSALSIVRPPRTLRSYIRVKSRAVAANRLYWRSDLPRAVKTPASRVDKTIAILRRPAGWPDALVYVGLTVAIRVVALRKLRHGDADFWERDETTRSRAAQDL